MDQVQFASMAATASIAFGIFYGSVTDSPNQVFGLPFDWGAAGAGIVVFVAVDLILRYLAKRSKGGDRDG